MRIALGVVAMYVAILFVALLLALFVRDQMGHVFTLIESAM